MVAMTLRDNGVRKRITGWMMVVMVIAWYFFVLFCLFETASFSLRLQAA